MIRTHFRTPLLVAALVGLGAAAPAAGQTYVTGYDSDVSFNTWAAENDWSKQFGANMRWGNNALNGDWEWGIVDGGDAPLAQDNFMWNGQTYGFSFRYDPFQAALQLGNQTLTSGVSGGTGITHIFARASKFDQNLFSGFNSFNVFLLDEFGNAGENIFSNALAADSDAEYIGIEDQRLAGGFVIRGEITLDGTGRTAGSRPMGQFKVGTAQVTVPESETWLLMLTGVGLFGVLARRRQRGEAA